MCKEKRLATGPLLIQTNYSRVLKDLRVRNRRQRTGTVSTKPGPSARAGHFSLARSGKIVINAGQRRRPEKLRGPARGAAETFCKNLPGPLYFHTVVRFLFEKKRRALLRAPRGESLARRERG